jgi:hypothetical protein
MKKRSFIYVVSLGSRQFVVHTGVGHVKLAFNDISLRPDLYLTPMPVQKRAYILTWQPGYGDYATEPCC